MSSFPLHRKAPLIICILIISFLLVANVDAQAQPSLSIAQGRASNLGPTGSYDTITTYGYDDAGRIVDTVIEGPIPDIAVVGLTIDQQTGNVLQGSLTLLNREEAIVTGIQVELSIIEANRKFEGQGEYDLTYEDIAIFHKYLLPQTNLTLAPQEQRTAPFQWTVPPVLSKDTYLFKAEAFTADRRNLGAREVPVSLSGTDSFVILKPQTVLVEAIDPISKETRSEWRPAEGPNILPKSLFRIVSSAGAVAPRTITAYAVARTTQSIVQNPSSYEEDAGAFSLVEAVKEYTLNLPLVAAEKPGAYDIDLYLKDEQGNRISTISSFHYVVIGHTASIVSADIIQYGTKRGDTTQVRYAIGGSADRLSGFQGKLHLAITSAGRVAGLQDVPITIPPASTIDDSADIIMQADACKEPGVKVTVEDDANTIGSTYEVPVDSSVVCAMNTRESVSKGSVYRRVLITVLITAMAAVIIFLIRLVQKRTGGRGDTGTSGGESVVPPILVVLVLAGAMAILIGLFINRSGGEYNVADAAGWGRSSRGRTATSHGSVVWGISLGGGRYVGFAGGGGSRASIGGGGGLPSSVSLSARAPVSAPAPAPSPVTSLSPTPATPAAECSDGSDNDGDGLIDCTPGAEDPGCRNSSGICDPNDDSELDILSPIGGSAPTFWDLQLQATASCWNVTVRATEVRKSQGGSTTSAPISNWCNLVTPPCVNTPPTMSWSVVKIPGPNIPFTPQDEYSIQFAANSPGVYTVQATPTFSGGYIDNSQVVSSSAQINISELDASCVVSTPAAPPLSPLSAPGPPPVVPPGAGVSGSSPQCSDGIDNDGDGLTDCTPGAEDPGCRDSSGVCSATDDRELNAPVIRPGHVGETD